MGKRYTLYIKAYTPETIPMARLAQYMQNLAALLGHDRAVHFDQFAVCGWLSCQRGQN